MQLDNTNVCLYKGCERDAAGQGGKAASKALVLVQDLQKERIKPFFFFFFKEAEKSQTVSGRLKK